MSQQFTLDIGKSPSRGQAFFLQDTSNKDALQMCDDPKSWAKPHLFLIGPAKSGKTLLAEAARLNSIHVCEDLDRRLDTLKNQTTDQDVFERDLFHRLNWVQENDQQLLITSRQPAAVLQISMPDLKSRLLAMTSLTVGPPSDALFRKLLVKHFSDRQIQIDGRALDYLVTHAERSHEAAHRLVDILDQEALKAKKRLSVHFIKSVLQSTP